MVRKIDALEPSPVQVYEDGSIPFKLPMGPPSPTKEQQIYLDRYQEAVCVLKCLHLLDKVRHDLNVAQGANDQLPTLNPLLARSRLELPKKYFSERLVALGYPLLGEVYPQPDSEGISGRKSVAFTETTISV